MSPLLKKIAIAGAALAVLGILGLSGLMWWAHSPAGSAYALQKVERLLSERAGMTISYSEISFDPLSHLRLKNLRVRTVENGPKLFGIEKLDMTIPELDADYSVSILARKFEMTHLLMKNPVMEFRGHSVPPKPGAKTGMELFKEFVEAPPADVNITDAAIENFSGNIDYKMGPREFVVQMTGASAHARLKALKEDFYTAGDLEVPENAREPNSLSYNEALTEGGSTGKRDFKSVFFAKTSWDVNFLREMGKWTYKIGPSKLDGDLHELKFGQVAGKHEMDVAIPTIHFTTDAEVLARTSEFLSPSDAPANPLENTLVHGTVETSAVHVVQDGKPLQTGAQKMNLSAELSPDNASSLRLDAHYSTGVTAPDFLFKPSEMHWDTRAEVARDLKKVDSETRAELGGAELFKLVLNVNQESPIQTSDAVDFHVYGLVHVLSDEKLSQVVKSAAFLQKNGPFQTELGFDGHARGKNLSALDRLEGVFDASVNDVSGKFGKWVTQTKIEATRSIDGLNEKGSTEIKEVARPTIMTSAGAQAPSFDQPVRITHELQVAKELSTASVAVEIPNIDMGKNGSLVDNRFEIKGRLQQGNILSLEKVSGELNRAMLKLSAFGSGKVKEKEFESHGSLVLQMQDGFPKLPGQMVSGRVEFPWTLSVIHGRDIDFDGAVHLINLAWSKEAYRFKGLNGQVPISERLVWDGKKIQFSHLVHRNPFERVDFERIRPLIQSTDQVRIEEMGWEEKSYGPFLGFFSVDQNMLLAPQFDVSLATGKVYGEMYFDAYPATLEFGILSRLTGINLPEVVPHRFLTKVPEGDNAISGRSGFVVRLSNGSIDGRVDITEIGSSQLVTFINILDPKFENEKMNRARSVLGYGYPTLVGLSFDEGYMDMDLELSVLGISKNESFRGIAISPWISSATADVVSDLNSDVESKNKADQETVQ